ncbi:MAG: XerD/XerC family integrase [Candidatus Methanohalarchaeum thermophilum]|uniref:XerD/XerC family integrase n=1 Tax=Methanohalarchaeum thermophilum TaxID=1903181 RepID=A0A1Q6DVB1_METT1|nr:MAG: XerD/XerC family integrase [Candidatus Methanohalarchaeum thermophilum]
MGKIKNYKKRHQREIQNIKNSEKINPKTKKHLENFYRDLKVKDYSDSRILKLLNYMKILSKQINKDLNQATENDLKELVAWINQRDLAESTKRTYKIILKRFYKWLNNEKEHPEKIEFIETSYNRKNKLPNKLLKEKDIQKLIEATTNPRDKLLISLLWETGARIGELIDLTIDDIEDHRHGKKITIDGKTGQRRLPLIESVPYLRDWINLHPRSNEKQAPLWVNLGNSNKGQKCSYRNLTKRLKEAADKTGLDKPVNPHQFRHSRATYLANRFTEAQMCEWFGWVQGSDMPSRYIHLSGRDIDQSYAQIHGIQEDKEKQKSELSPITCPKCQNKNPADANLCSYCGQALSHEAYEKLEKAKTEQKEVEINKSELIQLIEEYEENGKISKKLLKKLL